MNNDNNIERTHGDQGPKDMYNPETNTLDIRSNGLYPSNVLSNLCSNGFRFDGMVCGSMEGFLQSLKQQDQNKQRQICSMKGGNARKRSVTSWQTDQVVWWKGQTLNRQSEEYQTLIRQAYKTMFDQSERFRSALMATRGITLIHTTGENNPYKTILTSDELCGILTELREDYDRKIAEQANEPKVRMIRSDRMKERHGNVYALHPSLLIDKKLVIRTNGVFETLLELREQLCNSLEKLKVDAIYEIEEKAFEIKLSPQPSDDNSKDYVIHTNFTGEHYIAFYAEDNQGNRQVIDKYEINE